MVDDRLKVLAEVAVLYYEDGLTQGEIARKLDISRSNISRLLAEARQKGVVDIRINYPWGTSPSLQAELMDRFALRVARVLKADRMDYKWTLRGLGALAARYLEGILKAGHTLAISWGTAVHEVVSALPPRKLGIEVVQMIGAVGSGDPLIDGPELARVLAQTLGGRYRYLHAPLMVKDEKVRQALLKEQRISETLELARRADIALVGIGSVEPSVSSLIRAGYIDEEELEATHQKGAVGDICACQFDVYGRVLDIELNRRVVGIDLESLKRIDCVIGVAGGVLKAPAILGALRGRFVDVLVTDEKAAEEVLQLAEECPAPEGVMEKMEAYENGLGA
jgi:deoxyribonucleoside regulator